MEGQLQKQSVIIEVNWDKLIFIMALKNPRSIKIPVFKFLLYSSLAYVGYVYYQDHKYKEALSNLNQGQKPLKKMGQLIQEMQKVKTTAQLSYLFRTLQSKVEQYFLSSESIPERQQKIYNFDWKKTESGNEYDWWLYPFSKTVGKQRSFFHWQTVQESGLFGWFFWLNVTSDRSNTVKDCESIKMLLKKALSSKNQNCMRVAKQNPKLVSYSVNEQFQQCLSALQGPASNLEKMRERIKLIQRHQVQSD